MVIFSEAVHVITSLRNYTTIGHPNLHKATPKNGKSRY